MSDGWRDIASAPKDGKPFLTLQEGEVYVAKFTDDLRLCFRNHYLREPKTYHIIQAEMDGNPVEARVLTHEGPDVFEHHWSIWTKGFDFKPTHWMPLLLPVTQ